MSLSRFQERPVERQPVERLPEVLTESAFARTTTPRHLGEVESSGMCVYKFHGLDEERLKSFAKIVWPERAFEIISLSWIRGLIFIKVTGFVVTSKLLKIKHLSKFFKHYFHRFNTLFGFVLCRLRGAVKLPENGLLYA